MGIQRCKKCGTKFNYMDVLDSVGWGYKPLSCRNCGAQHNLKMLYIFILAILLTLPIFFIGQIRNYILTMSLKMILVVLFYIVMPSLIPYIL